MKRVEQVKLFGGPADGLYITVETGQLCYEFPSMGKTHVYRRVPIKPLESKFYHDGFVGQVLRSGVVKGMGPAERARSGRGGGA